MGINVFTSGTDNVQAADILRISNQDNNPSGFLINTTSGVIPHFEYVFPIRRKKPWVTLILFTWKDDPIPLSTPSPPTLGSQVLTVQSITIRIRDKLFINSIQTTGSVFFEDIRLLWRRKMNRLEQELTTFSSSDEMEVEFRHGRFIPNSV
ncbi:unnamed protein product [Cyclocybe aegerita]|uniref:Uncharacterized protein n=1 Tax=Cyclocybe aegerita TaxID=1973307 RepID=A0A8S0W5U4_CYCAE|nr:unnamed protein product [Cyclocybe aegerita]